MNFDFSDDIKAMASEVRRALERHCPMDEVRRCLEDGTLKPGGQMSKPTWHALADMGVLGAAVPEQWGGSGLSLLELAACAEEIGRACAPVPTLSSVYLATEALMAIGTDELRGRWLPELTSGTSVGTVLFGQVEPGCRSINAHLSPVAAGGSADLLLILGFDGHGACIDLRHPGVSRNPLSVIDPGYPLTELSLSHVPCEPLTFCKGSLQSVFDTAVVLLAFEQLGGASRALDMARAYTMQRKTFGRTVASYQAVKHLLADVWAKIELARGHVYCGAWAAHAGDSSLPLAAACARVAASEAFEFAAQEGLHLHGGLGFTWEGDAHPLYKRARSSALALEPIPVWKRRITEMLAERMKVQEHAL